MESTVRRLGGLDSEMLSVVVHFTEVQKFLLALGRALLVNTKIIAIEQVGSLLFKVLTNSRL